jgi:serine/threonine protein kinase
VHGAGLVHGDVKTANAMLDADGRTILLDFGSGDEASSGGAMLEEPGWDAPTGESARGGGYRIRGTPVAMAPELLRGEPASTSSDLYALGILLYRMATGRYPFRGAGIEDLLRELERQEPIRLEEARPDLPAAFANVVHRAIGATRSMRPASAEQMEWLVGASLGLDEGRDVPAESKALPAAVSSEEERSSCSCGRC